MYNYKHDYNVFSILETPMNLFFVYERYFAGSAKTSLTFWSRW